MKKEAKSEKTGTGKKIGKILLWVFAVVGVLIIGIVIWVLVGSRSDKNVEQINLLHATFYADYNLFLREYDVATASQISGDSSLNRALEGVKDTKMYINSMKGNATEILSIIAKSKGEYDGDQLTWMNYMESCWNKEVSALNQYEEVMNNEEKYLLWYNSSLQFDRDHEKYVALVDSWYNNDVAGNEQAAIDDLNNMKTTLASMKVNLDNAQKAIVFSYTQDYLTYTAKEDQIVELILEYYALTDSSEATAKIKQITDKMKESGAAYEQATSSKGDNEFDKWWTDNVNTKADDAGMVATQANNECQNAVNIFAAAFPGNAAVIAEINTTN